MKKKKILTFLTLGILSTAGIITPNVANASSTVQTKSNSSLTTLKSVIPIVQNSYWNNWRHVKLTKPLVVNSYQPLKNNVGGWQKKLVSTKTLPIGSNIYVRWYQNYRTQFEVMTDHPTNNKYTTSKQAVSLTKIKGIPNFKLINDSTNVVVNETNFSVVKYDNFNSHNWKSGVYSGGGAAHLFSSKKQFENYDKLLSKAGDLGDAYDDPTPKEQKLLNKVQSQVQRAKNKANVKFNNFKRPVLVRQTSNYKLVSLNNKVYYSEIENNINVYNTYLNGTNTIQSHFAPTKANQRYIRANRPIYAYKGEKWIGQGKWQFNGKNWVKK